MTLACLPLALALTAPVPGAPAEVFELDHALTVDLGGLTEIEQQPADGDQLLAAWTAAAGEVRLSIELFVLDRGEFDLAEPQDVTDLVEDNRKDGLRFEETELLESEFFGWTPYAALARGTVKEETRVVGTFFCLGGLCEEVGYSLEVACTPVPQGEDLATVLHVLREGLTARVESTRPWQWTEEEIEQRWEADVPEELWGEMEPVVRTEHYIVLTNSFSGKKFGQKMEECYEAVTEIFPVTEIEQRRLMPVFLFRTRDQYAGFYAKVADISIGQAMRSAGHAWKDYYATTYEAPGDPVHVHEATHQIFKNRLRLRGGGSWFQEGVAEYVETNARTRKNWASKAARKGYFTPFAEFFQVPSMLYSSQQGSSEASDNYTQAASIIEFARDGKWQPEKFPDFVAKVGGVPRGDLAAIEAALLSVYGVGVEGFQEQWVAYWKKK